MFFQGAVKTLLIAAAMSSVLAFLPDGAAAQESYSNCELVQNLFEQIECFSSLAVEKKDMAVCDGALHEGVRYQCYAVFAEKLGRWQACMEIPPKPEESRDLRDLCISDVAANKGDPSLCEKISAQGFKDSCYYKIAKEKDAAALCEKIVDPGLKSGCTGKPVYVK